MLVNVTGKIDFKSHLAEFFVIRGNLNKYKRRKVWDIYHKVRQGKAFKLTVKQLKTYT